jgi:acyl transferase domain-containing protein
VSDHAFHKPPVAGPALSPTQQAILDVRALRARLEANERRLHAPVAIIGMACRFPGNVDSLQAFWRLLSAGIDAISEIPADRWDSAAWYDSNADAPGKMSTRYGGFLQDVDRFDAEFFGISDREAVSIDPQHRLLLELSCEALENAGLPPMRLRATPSGVFVGISSFDYGQLRGQLSDYSELDAYHATGIAHSAASGRLSYYLGLQGPSISIDTACSSSLVAVHLACQSLRTGECRLALAGGVNLILSPEIHIALSKARMMSLDGRCKAFDDRADGFVRSEGCGIVVLKMLADAVADGDHIHAVVRGSACNQDGRSSGMTAPNGPSQTAVLRAAWRAAGIGADELGYVEAHGTGTALGDPIEAGALAAALEGLPPKHVLAIGSVKTNLGHMEAAAGVGGLIKTVLALENEQLPPSLHFHKPSNNIDWERARLKVVRKNTPWPRGSKPRLAGVSSFGFSGTNVHMVIEEPPPPPAASEPDRSVHVLTLSAQNEPTLREVAAQFAEILRSDCAGATSLANVAYTANVARTHFNYRAAIVAASAPEAAAALAGLAESRCRSESALGRAHPQSPPHVVFVAGSARSLQFDPQGNLYGTVPAFRAAIDRCAELYESQFDDHLFRGLAVGAAMGGVTDVRQQLAIFALQWALAQTWRAWGVEPAAVAGSDIGAYVAGCVAGVFSLEDGFRLAIARSRLNASACSDGSVWSLSQQELRGVAESVRYSPARLPLLADVLQRTFAAGEIPSATQWVLRAAETNPEPTNVDAICPPTNRIFLELAPYNTLGRSNEEHSILGGEATCLSSQVADSSPDQQMFKTLAQLYVRGTHIDWMAVECGHRRQLTELPRYPWNRRRYWFPVSLHPMARSSGEECWRAILVSGNQQAEQIPIDLHLHTYADKYLMLDQLATAYILRAFRKMKVFAEVGEMLRPSDLVESYGVLPLYSNLMDRWLQKLASEGVLVESAGTFTAVQPPLSTSHLDLLEIAAGPLFADAPMLLDYVMSSGRSLASLLVGQTGPLDILFPGGSLELAEAIYHRAPLSRYFHAIVGAIAGTFARLRGHPRVLELGAGTGGTTAAILPMLPLDRTEYAFTDVSELFLSHAARRFESVSCLNFGLLDLERSPESQGYKTGHYDLIVAANVLHATKDLGQTLDFVRSLLSADGVLVLYEVTNPPSYFDVSIALIEGWQKSADSVRDNGPLLNTREWQSCLLEHGFQEIACWPNSTSPAEVLGSHVFAVRATSTTGSSPARVAAASQIFQAVDHAPAVTDDILGFIADAPESEHFEILVRYVRQYVTEVLRRTGPTEIPRDQRLMDSGLDSLMAVELRNRLGQGLHLKESLPATLIFDHPSIADIATNLLARLKPDSTNVPHREGEHGNVSRQSTVGSSQRMTATALDKLSDAEVARLLNDKLEQE